MWQSPPVQTKSPTARSVCWATMWVSRAYEARLNGTSRNRSADRGVELEEGVTRCKGHRRDVRDVPRRDDVPPGVRVGPDPVDHLGDLVDVLPVRGGPRPPLDAVHGAELAVLVRPLVPDRHTVLAQPADVGLPAQEPQQLVHLSLIHI